MKNIKDERVISIFNKFVKLNKSQGEFTLELIDDVMELYSISLDGMSITLFKISNDNTITIVATNHIVMKDFTTPFIDSLTYTTVSVNGTIGNGSYDGSTSTKRVVISYIPLSSRYLIQLGDRLIKDVESNYRKHTPEDTKIESQLYITNYELSCEVLGTCMLSENGKLILKFDFTYNVDDYIDITSVVLNTNDEFIARKRLRAILDACLVHRNVFLLYDKNDNTLLDRDILFNEYKTNKGDSSETCTRIIQHKQVW